MEVNDLKPTSEEIKLLKESPFMFISELGRRLEKEEKPSDKFDKNKLEAILKEFSLEKYLNDFALLVSIIQEDFQEFTEDHGTGIPDYSFEKDLINALKFLFNNDAENSILDLKQKTYINKVSISNPYLIEMIREALLKKYIEIFDLQKELEKDNSEDIGKYFENLYSKKEVKFSKKGRKYENEYLGFCVQEIFSFLHFYIGFKAPKGIISRKQASFIYKYLDFLGFFPDRLSWEEDNIRHILIQYCKKDIEGLGGIVLNINKNK